MYKFVKYMLEYFYYFFYLFKKLRDLYRLIIFLSLRDILPRLTSSIGDQMAHSLDNESA